MKKLIMAVAVCCAAVAVQAASVKWDSATLYTPTADGGSTTTKIGANATGYLFTLTEAEYNSFLAAYNDSGDMSTVWDTYKDSLTGGTASSSRSSAVLITTTADVGDTVYAAVIYTTTATFDGAEKDFYIANIGTGTVGSDAGISIGNLGNFYLGDNAGTATGGWTAVPEPTSGLMLLLGVAGLALKRKRA